MNVVNGVMTGVLLVLFIGIWVWAWSGRNRKNFDEMANLPLQDVNEESGVANND